MPATDITKQELLAATPEGTFKAWLTTAMDASPANWSIADLLSSTIAVAAIAQNTKNSAITIPADQLGSYSTTLGTPSIDSATQTDIVRKTHSVTVVKGITAFDEAITNVIARG